MIDFLNIFGGGFAFGVGLFFGIGIAGIILNPKKAIAESKEANRNIVSLLAERNEIGDKQSYNLGLIANHLEEIKYLKKGSSND